MSTADLVAGLRRDIGAIRSGLDSMLVRLTALEAAAAAEVAAAPRPIVVVPASPKPVVPAPTPEPAVLGDALAAAMFRPHKQPVKAPSKPKPATPAEPPASRMEALMRCSKAAPGFSMLGGTVKP